MESAKYTVVSMSMIDDVYKRLKTARYAKIGRKNAMGMMSIALLTIPAA